MSSDYVSIVLPTHNRLPLLKQTIGTLVMQQYPREGFELIIVNDGSTDGTLEWLNSSPKIFHGVTVHIINQQQGGPAKARNAGIARATGKYIVLIDDDCLADPHWLHELMTAAQQYKRFGAIGGCIQAKESPSIISRYCSYIHYNVGGESLETRLVFANTANVIFSAAILHEIGGFDETFLRPGGEDAEISMRILDHGYRLLPCPTAIVHHLNKESFRSIHQAFFNQARGASFIHGKRCSGGIAGYLSLYTFKLFLACLRVIIDPFYYMIINMVRKHLSLKEAFCFTILDRTTKLYAMCGRIVGRIEYMRVRWSIVKTDRSLKIESC